MRKITAMTVQKRNPNRVNVDLDGEFAFGLSRIVAGWLKIGQELSDEKIEALQNEDALEAAYQQALLLLGYRARSLAEVRKNLRKHEVPEQTIEATIARLERAGLVNDGQFAQAWVENRNTFRPRGKRALALELRQKGLSDEVIRETLNDNVDESVLALQAAQKYVRKLEKLEWPDFRRKLIAFLARRGFSYSVAAPVVSQTWSETHPANDQKNLDDEEIA
jgi:regulatory protein